MQFTDVNYLANLHRIGIHWYESFSNSFQGGLELGYLDMLQASNPQISAQASVGEYAGLLFRFLLINKNAFAFNINLNYRYNRSKGTSAQQESKFSWHESLIVNELQYKVSNKMNLSLAAEYRMIDGSLRTTTADSMLQTFNTQNPYGVRYGLKYKLSQTEVIGFDWSDGNQSGGKIYFGRSF